MKNFGDNEWYSYVWHCLYIINTASSDLERQDSPTFAGCGTTAFSSFHIHFMYISRRTKGRRRTRCTKKIAKGMSVTSDTFTHTFYIILYINIPL